MQVADRERAMQRRMTFYLWTGLVLAHGLGVIAMVTGHDSWRWALLGVPLFVLFVLTVTGIEARARRRPFRVFARQTWTAVRGGPTPPP